MNFKKALFLFAFRCLVVLCFSFVLLSRSTGQGIPPKPDPPRLVNDFAHIMGAGEIQTLENKLIGLDRATSIQMVVITLRSLNGFDKNELARMIGESWGVGQTGKNNGIVILVKPKYQGERGEVAIQVGYGLEGTIPDAIAKRIINQEMVPQFRHGNYYEGIDLATTLMIHMVKGEYTAYTKKQKNSTDPNLYLLIIPLILLGFIYWLIWGGWSHSKSIGKKVPFLTLLKLYHATGSSHRGSWEGFTGNSYGYGGGGSDSGRVSSGSIGGTTGGFGSGGFGGFGGGSFGGGGAGGSW